jgi:hypothetical protein
MGIQLLENCYHFIEFLGNGKLYGIFPINDENLYETIVDSLSNDERTYEVFDDQYSYSRGHYTTSYNRDVTIATLDEYPELIIGWINNNQDRWEEININD